MVRRRAESRVFPDLLAIVIAVAIVAGCAEREEPRGPSPAPPAPRDLPAATSQARPLAEESTAAIQRFCGDCHAVPRPESFPRDVWPKEVRQGYDLYLATGRSDLVRPVERDALGFFMDRAPERLEIPRADAADTPETSVAAVRFLAEPLGDTLARVDPAIAQVIARTDGGLLTTDMRHGDVSLWRRGGSGWTAEVIARSSHPCRVMPAPGGLLLADLGSFLPEDHDRGGVFAIDRPAEGENVSPRRLAAGLSRTVEAHAFDANEDGQEDLVVAEFGWLSTGGLRLLLADGKPLPYPAGVRPALASGYGERILDPRHGVLGVRLVDLDGDGRRDIVAAFAQEHETVDVWWNRGEGRFDHARILTLPDPSFGSSGFDVADLDDDGRTDILHVNGDTMDSGLAKPYHAIRRIMNRGAEGFHAEEVAAMPGVCQAAAVDLDLDGDTDIVAAALHPGATVEPPGTFDAILWLERLPDGGYRRHSIERDRCDHAAFAIADVDGDGRPDIVAGCWRAEEERVPRAPLTVFLNRARD